MRNARLLFLTLLAAALAQGQYFYTETFNSPNINPGWYLQGLTPTSNGVVPIVDPEFGSGSGFMMFENYLNGLAEVKLTTAVTQGSGAVFQVYLSSYPQLVLFHFPPRYSYYVIELSTIGPGYVTVYRRINDQWVQLASTILWQWTVPPASFTIRAVKVPGGLRVRVENAINTQLWVPISTEEVTVMYGGAGVSGTVNSAVTSAALGPLDTTPPGTIPSIGTSVTPARVDLSWSAVTDNAGGSGLIHYEVYRDSNFLGTTTGTTWTDWSPPPGNFLTYKVRPVDFHGNYSETTVSVNIPSVPAIPTSTYDPRQVGVRASGVYWGAMGEQIDMRSGNLNFTLPVLRAVSRGSAGVGLALNYNSQQWRKDNGGTWKFGGDVGYGFGWRLMAGAITPIWSDVYTFSHYLFTDSTGAEYRLNSKRTTNPS